MDEDASTDSCEEYARRVGASIRGLRAPAQPANAPDSDRDSAGPVPRPALFEFLAHGSRVSVITAPAGSGKTVLLRTWIEAAGIADRVACEANSGCAFDI